MNQTVVGVFNTYQAAQSAATELAQEGFDRDQVQVKATDSSDASTAGTGRAASGDSSSQGTGVMASIREFFSDLFGDDDNAGTYTEAVRRGGAVVTVDADDDRLDRAREVLTRCGAVDIEEQVSQWRSEGWTGYDEDGIGSARPQAVASSPMQSQGTVSGQDRMSDTDRASGEQNVLPVIEEELQVGKRQVQGGVVRVVSRVVSRPVTESVELRSEEAVVERRNVDRPATEADLGAFQERTIEIEETEERAVVNKSAHVVEEVVVGKQVHHETEQVEDSVRRTEVEVERVGAGSEGQMADRDARGSSGSMGGSGTGTQGGMGASSGLSASGGMGSSSELGSSGGMGSSQGSGSAGMGGGSSGTMSSVGSSGSLGGASMTGASTTMSDDGSLGGGSGAGMGSSMGGSGAGMGSSMGGSSMGGGASARRSFSDYEDDFRNDWQTNHSSSGGRYEDFQPAYRSGYELRGDSQFADRDWDDAEPHIRQRWESDNPGSTWEHVKSAVRRGWERATS